MSEKCESNKHQKRAKHICIILVLTILLLCGCYEETPTKDTSKPFLPLDYDIQNAVYSPDGEYIVFSSKMDDGEFFDIWMITYDGEGLKQITFDNYDQIQPSMSHDNEKIVFSAYDDIKKSWNLWEYSFKTKSLKQLTNDIFNQSFPIYTNDDLKVIYSSNEGLPKYKPLDGVEILRRIWILDINENQKKLLYDSNDNCYHPSLLKNTDKVIFSYYYDPEFGIFEGAHLQLFISSLNGKINKTIDINDCDIYYSASTDENNVIFSIHYWESFTYNYGQCVGHYNLQTNNFTIILANCDYSIDQLSYSLIENKIMINCCNNNTKTIRKFIYQPEDNNGNGFADNIEDFPDRDPTAPLSIHYEDSEDNKNGSDNEKIELYLIGNIVHFQIIIVLIVIILILVLIILIYFLKRSGKKKEKQKSEVTGVKFIEEK